MREQDQDIEVAIGGEVAEDKDKVVGGEVAEVEVEGVVVEVDGGKWTWERRLEGWTWLAPVLLVTVIILIKN